MSKIAKALEKARRERGDTQDQRLSAKSALPSEIAGTVVQSETGSSDNLLPIRIVEPDQSTMEKSGVILANDDRFAVSAYRILRTRLLQRMQQNNWRSAIVTGASVGDGKSLTAINLAISIARDENHCVTLVDLDFRRPSIAALLGLPPGPSLSDYLQDNAEFDEILYSIGVDRLSIVPNFQEVEHSSEILTSPRIAALLRQIGQRNEGDIVIFDLPPLLVSDDVIAFMPMADCVLIVAAEGITPREDISKMRELLGDTALAGVVLNQCSESNDVGYY